MSEDKLSAKLELLAAHGGRELRTKEPHWGDAILCDGLIYATRGLSSDAPAEDAISWFAPKLSGGPRTDGWIWFWSAEALTALDIYLLTSDAAYLNYARQVVSALEGVAARTEDGAIIPHPPAVEVWIDISYFSAPAMARLARLSGDAALMERALDQLLVHNTHLVDHSSGLYWHVAYPEKHGHSPCLWARGNSWFSIAAAEVVAEVSVGGLEHRLADKAATVKRALATQLNAVVKLQDASGLWHTVIDRPDSYLEASASAGFALGLGRAIRMKLEGLERTNAERAYRSALEAISGKINERGEFTSVSQQTPPGDFDFYQSIKLGTAPFGTGVCLMALAEALAA